MQNLAAPSNTRSRLPLRRGGSSPPLEPPQPPPHVAPVGAPPNKRGAHREPYPMASLSVLIGAAVQARDHGAPAGGSNGKHDVVEVVEDTPTPPPTAQGPPRLEDWEARKPAIRELYMDQNLNLNEVVERMRVSHNFRATPRMYKAQFAKWGWSKYNSKRLRRDISSGRTVEKSNGKSCRRVRQRRGVSNAASSAQASQHSSSALAVAIKREDGPLHPLTFENDLSFNIASVLMQIRSHVFGFYTRKREWKETPETGLINAYNYSFYDSFRIAMDNFNNNQNFNGGKILRQAFVDVEEAIQHDYSAAFYFLFIDLPDLFYHYGRNDILVILLDYINKLANVKLKDKILGAGFVDLQSLVLSDPSHLGHYIKTASQLWLDLLAQLRGPRDRSTLLAKRNFLRHSRTVDKSQVQEICQDYDHILKELNLLHGSDSPQSRQLEDVTLLVQSNHNLFLDDFEPRTVRLISDITNKYRYKSPSTVVDGTIILHPTAPVTTWDILDRSIYSNGYDRLSSFYAQNGDMRRAAECRAKAREGWRGEFWQYEVEQALLAAGRLFEAETLRKSRLESQYFRKLPDNVVLMPKGPS